MPGPHDLFVRFTFSKPEHAAAELRAALPPQLVAQVDWTSLRREPSGVVDAELRESESDLLFSARTNAGRTVLFYVLLEHQSSVDRWMALRMLRYVLRLLERWRQEHPGSSLLPIILPLVLYHGPGGTWSAPLRLEELFDVPGEGEHPEYWTEWVPRFEYRVDDLMAQLAEALMRRPGPPQVQLALLALRYGRTEELAERLPGWAALLAQLRAAPDSLEELSVLFHYLTLVAEKAARPTTVAMLKSVVGAHTAEELMLSWSEEHFERGRQQGKAEGKAEGMAQRSAEYLLRTLTARGLHVDDQARQRILSCTDMPTLDLWFDRALKATRLSEVLDDLAQ